MRSERKELVVELPRSPQCWSGAGFAGAVRLRRGSRQVVLAEDEWQRLLDLMLKLTGKKAVALQ